MQMVDAVLFDYGGVLTGPVKHSIASWVAAYASSPSRSRARCRRGCPTIPRTVRRSTGVSRHLAADGFAPASSRLA
jgi:hypothetical protein